jgi:hypothetical protein
VSVSGDFCRFGVKPSPAHMVTHYRCDDFADGTVTDASQTRRTIVKPALSGAPRGFERRAPVTIPNTKENA